MRWSQVVVVALVFAGCSAYNELSPEPPITPLERGYIELKKDDEAFVLEKEAKYYVKFPGPVRDQFLLVLSTRDKWALGSYLTKTFGDDDVPPVKIPDEAPLNDSIFVYALEPRVPVFTWVIDTVRMDLTLALRYRYVPRWRFTFENKYADFRRQLTEGQVERSVYSSITPSYSFDTFDFNGEQLRLEKSTRVLTAVNEELLALESLFPPDIAGSRDTAYENYLALRSELADELAFQKNYATVLEIFKRERDSRGNSGLFLASAGLFAEFLGQSDRYPPAIREKARLDFTRRLQETQPHYERQLREKRDPTPIALDPPIEPVLALYSACGVQSPPELRMLMDYVESYNGEARALQNSRAKLRQLEAITKSTTRWGSDSLYVDLIAIATEARRILPESRIDRIPTYGAFPASRALRDAIALTIGEAASYQALYQTARAFASNLNAGSWMIAETILRDLHTSQQFANYPTVEAQKRFLVARSEEEIYNRVLAETRRNIDEFIAQRQSSLDNIQALYNDPVFTPVHDLTFSAGGQSELTRKKAALGEYIEQAKYVRFPETAIGTIHRSFTANMNDRGVEKARAIVAHGKYYRGKNQQITQLSAEFDVELPKLITKPKDYRRVFVLPVTDNRQGTNEYLFRLQLQIPSEAQFPVYDITIKLPEQVARNARQEQWYESITINRTPIKNEGRFRITAPTSDNNYESLITPVQMDRAGRNILEVRFRHPSFRVFEVSAMAQVPIIRKN